MKVRFSPVIAWFVLLIGVALLALGIWATVVGTFSVAIVVGVVGIALGWSYFVRPYFAVLPDAVWVMVIGRAPKDYPYQRLESEGGRLFAVGRNGNRTKLPLARWSCHSGDWDALVASLADPSSRRADR
ncbi:hypothetical protein ABZ816_33725 [Actinosynnema sp. NPDC047251]|uniref:Putative secreted protein n=1 Tax=Saccharothrix espanaensis (strain ATCC 51144 / DSM 44229 / JCM 9112 / NBRC 15066 / NRRL 15764) TaxID=1179773 RepID=K0K8Y7_SACES|nr:hypothetical protein [Saccharothrix espanaensis]CCH33078.1 putative secreted protein [Saccharothrix espanaensis DSM 44229]